MSCRAPSRKNFTRKAPGYSDEQLLAECHRSWTRFTPINDKDLLYAKSKNLHDWANFRSVLLREVRKRGLEPPIGTLDLMAQNGVYLDGIA